MRAMHSNSPRPITTAGRRKKEARGAPGGTVAPRAVWPHSSLRSPVDPLPQRAVRSRVPESVAAIPPQGFRSPSNRYPLKTISKPCRRLEGACQGNERGVFLLGVCPSQEKRPSRAATLRSPVSVAARLSLLAVAGGAGRRSRPDAARQASLSLRRDFHRREPTSAPLRAAGRHRTNLGRAPRLSLAARGEDPRKDHAQRPFRGRRRRASQRTPCRATTEARQQRRQS